MDKSTEYDLILKSGKVMLPTGGVTTDIAVKDEKIIHIGDLPNTDSKCDNSKIINCKGFHILPGVIDTQVHFREPGLENKENLEFGMMAAAAGGVTGIFEMPNTDPLTITPEAIDDKIKRA